ncbi:hypothetical protein BXZ70DRAFT_949224 [Cristinia sonorae]|uniref:Uncharacterized protein n=1 Tax=Cristinia sonorae TaxID=1940300 RepID=A0A8K0UL19_9AGAR|nr:hypothetical protein BXZ70DRAFT_949224 [Cristinia sonorae]
MYHWHRGPSRLVWFMIGAFSATWWWKHKQGHNGRVSYCSRPELPANSYQPPPYYPQHPHQQQPPPQSTALMKNETEPAAAAEPVVHTREWNWSWGSHTPLPPPPVDHGWDEEKHRQWEQERWEKRIDEEKQKLQNIGRQATDTFADFSEATLDGILSTVEAMKAKLAEHRDNRERQIREWQTWREQQIKQLEDWKKMQEQQNNRS